MSQLLDSDFDRHCRAAFDDLRAALIEVYASVGADPVSPQEVSRRFKVNKTLTWNLSKVMAASDPIAILPSVPGLSAMNALLQALQKNGATNAAVERVRKSAAALQQVVELHIGDRGTLELIVDGIGPERNDHLELSRKLAFRGNSGLWGVQARTRLMSVFLAPNAMDPTRLDMAIVRGYLGFRRLRSDVRWPLFQLRGWGAAGEPVASDTWQPLAGPGGDLGSLPLMDSFSTVSPADFEVIQRGVGGADYVLLPGPVGNAGAVDCFIGDHCRSAASMYRSDIDKTGEFGATISAPTERLIFDLLVHESLDFALHPEVFAVGGLSMEGSENPSGNGLMSIPVPSSISALPGRPLAVATAAVPRYAEIVSFVQGRMGWDPSKFLGRRLELNFPPLGCTIFLRFQLPASPA